MEIQSSDEHHQFIKGYAQPICGHSQIRHRAGLDILCMPDWNASGKHRGSYVRRNGKIQERIKPILPISGKVR
jgi:hypothetical protein